MFRLFGFIHEKSKLKDRCQPGNVMGVYDQGATFQLLGRAGELAENQNAQIVRSCRAEFFGDKVHAVF